jgi:cation:H+ antiporter
MAALPDGSPGGKEAGLPTLKRALITFAAAAVIILVVAPFFAVSARRLAEATGLAESFVGTWLVGLSTSLPELVTALAAVRIGAYDLAVGNLFGSNAVNMVMFLPLDLVHGTGPILGMVHPVHAVSALVAVVLMAVGLAAIVYQAKGKLSMLEPSSGLILLGYLLGLAIVYAMSAPAA